MVFTKVSFLAAICKDTRDVVRSFAVPISYLEKASADRFKARLDPSGALNLHLHAFLHTFQKVFQDIATRPALNLAQ